MSSHRIKPPTHGLSIVELLIGVALGLFILAGAAMVATNQITDNRRLLLETQIQQDMRTAMDIIVRDIRRSGYSFNASKLPAVGESLPAANGYHPAGAMSSADSFEYTYSKEASNMDNGVADAVDYKGFRQHGDVIQVQLSQGNWQALTDGDVVKITTFSAVPSSVTVNLPASCATPPCGTSPAGCGDPRIVLHTIQVTMEGVARHDDRVKRRLESTVRVRNDELACL